MGLVFSKDKIEQKLSGKPRIQKQKKRPEKKNTQKVVLTSLYTFFAKHHRSNP